MSSSTLVPSTVRSVVQTARDRNLTLLAAGFAYYAFVSVVPLALLALVVGSLLGQEAFARLLISRVEGFLSESGQEALSQALTAASGRTGASVVGVVTLAWSATKVFRGLKQAFGEIYESVDDPSLVDVIRDGLVVLPTVALAASLVVLLGTVLELAGLLRLPYSNLVHAGALLVGLTVVLLPLYYVLPPIDVSVREVLPGAAATALGWLALRFLFGFYVANAGDYRAYGVLGAVLLFVTWLYFAGIVLLGGAVLNVVLSSRTSAGVRSASTA
jgi:membrane protein